MNSFYFKYMIIVANRIQLDCLSLGAFEAFPLSKELEVGSGVQAIHPGRGFIWTMSIFLGLGPGCVMTPGWQSS